MIPADYFFMISDGTRKIPAHIAIPARSNAIYIFESREDVDEFIRRIKYFRDGVFGTADI